MIMDQQFDYSKIKNKNHVICSRELTMADETETILHKWLRVVLKRGDIVIKKQNNSTFGSLVQKKSLLNFKKN